MQQQMGVGSLAPGANGLRRHVRAAGASSLISSGARVHRAMVAAPLGGRPARLGGATRITAAHGAVPARSKDSWLLRGAAALIAAPQTSFQLADQQQHISPNISNDIGFFEVEMKVCDDELDEYGVVNNAIYASYIHRARDMALEHFGINADFWASTGCAIALSDLHLKYLLPLRSGDRFVVKMRPVPHTTARFIVHHLIETLPDHKPVLEARATVVCLNKDGRPTRVFRDMAAKFRETFGWKEA